MIFNYNILYVTLNSCICKYVHKGSYTRLKALINNVNIVKYS